MMMEGAEFHHQVLPQLPPGFRFHPTDEELLIHYLKKKVTSCPLPASIIAEIDLCKHDPWDLPAKACFGEQEWYFFSPRDRKYPNGLRPNRSAGSGYWKAAGKDKTIVGSTSSQKVGVKKSLVFYKGRPLKGIKTNWIMHEYRLAENTDRKGSMRLDDWVLCRIYKKVTHPSKVLLCPERDPLSPANVQQQSSMPNFSSSSSLLQSDCPFMESFLSHDTSDANATPFYMEPSSSLQVVPEQKSTLNTSNPKSPVSISQLAFNYDEAISIYAATSTPNTQNPSQSMQFQSWNPYVTGVVPNQHMYQLPFNENDNSEPPAWPLPPGNGWSSDNNE